jgi:hypothetical protein
LNNNNYLKITVHTMKNKNLILALLITASAIASSAASKLFVPSPTWVSGIRCDTGSLTCSTLGNVCDPATGNSKNCEVRIVWCTGVTTSTIGYNSNVCVIPYRTGNVVYGPIRKNLRDLKVYFPN